MSMNLREHFVRLFECDARCTPLVIDSLRRSRAKIEEVGLASLEAPHEHAVEIFCHMQAARRLWLLRVQGSPADLPPDGVFPVWPLEKAEAEALEMDALWAGFLRSLPAADVDRPVRYTCTEGAPFISTLSDILTHVVNHSSYHRGQIALLVAKTGVRPPVTDFIALTRVGA